MVKAPPPTLLVLALAAVTAAVPIVDGDNKTWQLLRRQTHHSLLLTSPCSAWAAVWRSQIVRLHWVVGRAAPIPIARAEAYPGPHPAPRDVEARCVSPPPNCIPLLSDELIVRLEEPCVGGPPGCLPPRSGCTGGPNGDACTARGRGEKRA
ncbi:hypothetical protein DFH09DRAFT_1314042 [Mycena vulgaris]|nr:hypothetical protein DFH09DRAFT_1314042 [Mycena vulgaris]